MSAMGWNSYQTAAIDALQALAPGLGFQGEIAEVEGTVVFQVPLPGDADINGVFFVIDAEHADVLLYLTLPHRCGEAGLDEASRFVARRGCGLRFGAIELDARQGTLRIRDNMSAAPAEMPAQIHRLFGRAVSLAREVSPGWQSICRRNRQKPSVEADALQRFRFT